MKERQDKKTHMEMSDGALLFEKHTTKQTKNTPKCPSTFFS